MAVWGIVMKREMGDIWKDDFLPKGSKYGGQWNIQLPKGVMNCRTRKEAKEWYRVTFGEK